MAEYINMPSTYTDRLSQLTRDQLVELAMRMWPWDEDAHLASDEELRRGIRDEVVRRLIETRAGASSVSVNYEADDHLIFTARLEDGREFSIDLRQKTKNGNTFTYADALRIEDGMAAKGLRATPKEEK